MSTEILAGALGELRAASTASGGTALTTTAGYIYLPLYARHLLITPRNFATAVVAKFALNPWLTVLRTNDNLLTPPTDYSENAQDGNSTNVVTLSDLSTLALGDFLLVGSHLPFRGVYCDVELTNSGSNSALTVHYWNGGWTSAGATDGTTAGSKTFAADGLVYWTVPTDWAATSLRAIYPSFPAKTYYSEAELFWTRWSVDVVLDESVTLNNMAAANRSTAYPEFVLGQSFEETIKHGFGGIGCIEALVNAGTGNLIVNAASVRDGRFK